jgi:hypothetical protein
MICVTGQLLRCLSTPWKTGPGWRVFIAQWRQPSQPHDRGLGMKRRQRRERRKATGRGSPLFGCCLAAVWLLYFVLVCMAGWLPPAFWRASGSVSGSASGKKRHLPPRRAAPTAPAPPFLGPHVVHVAIATIGFIGGRPWSGSDRVTSRRKPLSTARLSWPHRLLGAPMWCNNQY